MPDDREALAVFLMAMALLAALAVAVGRVRGSARCPECGSDRVRPGVRCWVRVCMCCEHCWEEAGG